MDLNILPKEIINYIKSFLLVKCSQCNYSKINCNKNIIKRLSFELTKCSQCECLLCDLHAKKALSYGYYYTITKNFYMCDNCCWNEIT